MKVVIRIVIEWGATFAAIMLVAGLISIVWEEFGLKSKKLVFIDILM